MLAADVCIRMIGAVCVISGCAGAGASVSWAYSRRYRQMGILRQMIMLIRGEIRYACSELPEAFEHVADRVEAPFSQFLKELSKDMRQMDGRTLETLWQMNTDCYLAATCLTKEDKALLVRLGGQLGFLDREMQLSSINLYLEQLETMITVFGQTIAQRQRLSVGMGLLSGCFLTVLLV